MSDSEAFLAAAIAAMTACGLASFLMAGRVSVRVHVSLALLVVLIGGFGLFTLFGAVERTVPTVGGIALLAMIGLFKLMNQFEIRQKQDRTDKPGR